MDDSATLWIAIGSLSVSLAGVAWQVWNGRQIHRAGRRTPQSSRSHASFPGSIIIPPQRPPGLSKYIAAGHPFSFGQLPPPGWITCEIILEST